MATNFAEFIKLQRERHSISKRKLASLTGITITAITNYESGKRSPSIVTAEKMCNALNVQFVLGVKNETFNFKNKKL